MLWRSGIALARELGGQALHGTRVVELGCGLGVPRVEPDEFIEGEETVTVLGHTSGRAQSDFKVPFVHVWRFEGGTPTRVQTLTDTAVIADAFGN